MHIFPKDIVCVVFYMYLIYMLSSYAGSLINHININLINHIYVVDGMWPSSCALLFCS